MTADQVRELLASLSIPASEREVDCLVGAVQSALTRAAYMEDPPEPLTVAACLLHQLGRVKHCLVDGNKRFAWGATVAYLDVEAALQLTATADDAEALVLQVATEEPELEDLVRWLAEHLTT